MNTQYLSVQEASNATGKHINTIRKLIEKKKVQYTNEGKRYLILRESLATIYRNKKEIIENFWTDKENNSTNSSNTTASTIDVTNQLKPLIDGLQFQIKRYEETQKLLTSSKEETLKVKSEYEEKLNTQRSTLEAEKLEVALSYKKKINHQKKVIKLLWGVLLFLLLVLLIMKGILLINLSWLF